METVVGSNQGESSTQDNVVKAPVYMATPDNVQGKESGVSTTAGLGTTAGESAPFAAPANEINISASEENRAAKYKYPSVSQDVPDAGRNQYQ